MHPTAADRGGRGPDLDEVRSLHAAHDAAVAALGAVIQDTTRLARMFTILSEPAPLPVLLDQALSTLSELFSSDVAVLLGPAAGGGFTLLASLGLPEHALHQVRATGEVGHLSTAARSRAPVVAEEARDDPRVDSWLRELAVRAAVFIPAVGNDGVAAVMVLARCHPAPYARVDLDLLMTLAYRIALLLERRRAEEVLRETQERLQQSERFALAGRLAASVAHEVNNPLACVRSSLETFRRLLPAIGVSLDAARDAAVFLAGEPGQAAGRHARELLAALEGGAGGQDGVRELAELCAEALDGVRRIGQLVESFHLLASTQPAGEPEEQDLRAIVAQCVADLPGGALSPQVDEGTGGERSCLAWVDPEMMRSALGDLLQLLLSPELRRDTASTRISVRAEPHQGRPSLVIADPELPLSPEARPRFFDPRLEEVDTPDGRTVRLSVRAAVCYQLLRRCGAEVSTASLGERGLTIRILLPNRPREESASG